MLCSNCRRHTYYYMGPCMIESNYCCFNKKNVYKNTNYLSILKNVVALEKEIILATTNKKKHSPYIFLDPIIH